MASPPEKFTGPCPDCGATVDGGRSGCQELFHAVLAREFSDYRYARNHRLTVDVYSLQHPSEYMRSAKSYAAHLTGVCAALEEENVALTNRTVQRWLNGPGKIDRPDNPPPGQRGSLTIICIHEAATPEEYAIKVRAWAESTWIAWHEYQELARRWIATARSRPGN